jgi:hypothetical protein
MEEDLRSLIRVKKRLSVNLANFGHFTLIHLFPYVSPLDLEVFFLIDQVRVGRSIRTRWTDPIDRSQIDAKSP